METIPLSEWLPDQPDQMQKVISVTNCIPTATGYTGYPALANVSSNALTDYCRGIIRTKAADGNSYNFAGDENKLYELVNGAWTDRSGTTYGLGQEDDWQFIRFGSYVIAAGFGNILQDRTVTGTGNFADISGAPEARALGEFKGFVVVGNTSDSTDGHVTNRVGWSKFGDHTGWDWAGGTGQSGYYDLPEGGSVQNIVSIDYAVIFQEDKITRMDYIGGDAVMDFRVIEEGRGLYCKNAVTTLGRNIFYMSQDGMYAMNGEQVTPIGENKFNNYLLSDIDKSYRYRASMTTDPVNGIILFAYAGSGHTSGLPNKIFVYSYRNQKSSLFNLEVERLGGYYNEGYTLEDLDAFGDLDSLTDSLDASKWKGGFEEVVAFSSTSYLQDFSGTDMTAVITLNDRYNGFRWLHDRTKLHGDGLNTIAMEIAGREAEGDTVSYDTMVSQYAGNYTSITSGYYHRYKITLTGGFDNITHMTAFFNALGEL